MTVIYDYKMIISSGVFSYILENFDFWGPQRGKMAKMVQNNKKLCLLRSISQELYIVCHLWSKYVK